MKILPLHYKGILLSTILGTIVYLISPHIPFINGILTGFLIGILIGNLFRIPQSFQLGIAFTGSKLLEVSILFLAFSINFKHIAAIGLRSFIMLIIVVLIALILTFYLSKKIKTQGAIGWLVGFGTIICGSSAIAALAPTITKNKDEVGISMAVVNLLGSIGMLLMPFAIMQIKPMINLSNTDIGIILGGSLHSVPNVTAAAYPLGNEIGETAITIKLVRVALLSPALILFNLLVNKNNIKHWKEHFRLPWYLWSFIGVTILGSFISFPASFTSLMETLGKNILLVSMCAIGMNISFRTLYQSGKKGIFFGLITFAIQIILVALLLI